MTLKPCIECGNDCEILPVQLGDLFTLTYLRVCSGKCLFMIAYEFMHDKYIHKEFRGYLWDKQDEEDKAERTKFVDETTEEALKQQLEFFQNNPSLLSTPAPDCILKMFESKSEVPSSERTVRFVRASLSDRIEWQSKNVERLKDQLMEAVNDLEKLQNEGKR